MPLVEHTEVAEKNVSRQARRLVLRYQATILVRRETLQLKKFRKGEQERQMNVDAEQLPEGKRSAFVTER